MSETKLQAQIRVAEQVAQGLEEWFNRVWEELQPVLQAWEKPLSELMDLLYVDALNYPKDDEEWDIFT